MQEGDILGGRFVAQHLAGQGAMGEVWRAHDRYTGAPVAVKVLLPQTVDVARFVREARFLAGIQHPHVVAYVAHGDERGQHYLVTEWLDGEDLAVHLERGLLGLEDAFALVSAVASGLGCVHDQGVVHRDVKPSNIFLEGGDRRRPKLIDFGIARALDRTATIGMVLGTPYYVAPEQAQGSDVDTRADVFSLGCVLFQCMRGRPPFDGDQLIAVLGKILFQSTPLTDIAPLDDVLRHMLAKDREQRPRDGHEVMRLLASRAGAAARTRDALTESREQSLVAVIGIGEARAKSGDAAADADSEAPTSSLHGATDLSSLAQRFGGRQARMMDGSSVVVFSASGSATDLAERAGRCALAIRAIDPSLRMAVALGRGDTSVPSPVGPALDRVASLLAETGGGVVSVDDTAAGLMRSMRLTNEGTASRLLGAEASEADRLVLGKATAFVGRDRELSTLVGLFEECVSERGSRCALVTAPPGFGKSRLTRELMRVLRARDGIHLWVGTGDPVGAGAALGMLSALVRTALAVDLEEALPHKRACIRAGTQRWGVVTDHQPRVAVFLGELCGIPFAEDDRPELAAARRDAALLGDQMRRAFEDLVEAATRSGPVVLILENLHWGDVSTVDFVESALRRCAELPLFVLALARPEVTDLFPKLWEARRPDSIRLGGLPKRAALELVRAILPDIAAADVERIVATADGNAFYLEELVRSIGSGRRGQLPETVLAMVESRLAALDAPIRRTLRTASVFGETFAVAGLRAVVHAPVDDDLAELERRELLLRRQTEWSAPVSYSFRHALVREAAYLGLTEDDRRELHGAVARHLEATGSTDPAVLAEHFEHAGARGDAARAWGQAAELALRSNAHREALSRAERAIALGADPGPQRGLQSDAASWLGDTALAAQHATEALARLPAGCIAWCRALAVAALTAGQLGRRDDLLRLADALVAIPSIPGAEEARVIAQSRAAVQYAIIGRLDITQQVHSQVAATTLPDDALTGRAWSHRLRANLGMYTADLQTFQDGSEEALRLFRIAADARSEAWQRVNVGAGLLLMGDYDTAVRQLEIATGEAEALGTHGVQRYGQEYLCNALRRLGQLDEAIALATEVARASMERGDRTIACQAHSEIAWCHLAAGRLDAADGEARHADALLGGASQHAREPATQLAAIALRRGRPDEALAHIDPVIFGAAEEYWEEDVVEWVIYAEALRGMGRAAEARGFVDKQMRRLERRAACFRSEERRASFLGKVAEHAALRRIRGETG